MGELVITFFTDVKKEQLLPLFIERGFKYQKNGSVCYSDETADFRIEPFRKEGRVEQGYRIHFEGAVDSLAFLLDRTIAYKDIKVVATEWKHQSELSQKRLVDMAKAGGFETSCGYGLLDYKGVGVVITKCSSIHFLFRRREGIKLSSVLRIAHFYNKMAETFSIPSSRHEGYRQEVLVV